MSWLTAFLRRPPISWWDLADILVVSILIYEVLKLIRGTRAAQMALGGGLFVALFYGSRWIHLETVNWLVRNLVGYIVFAVIVLFQSDIRRALAHFGRAPFFRYLAKTQAAEETIEELVVAASMLSCSAEIIQRQTAAIEKRPLPWPIARRPNSPAERTIGGNRHRLCHRLSRFARAP